MEDKRKIKLLAMNSIQEIAVGNNIKIIKKNIEKILLLCTDYIDFTDNEDEEDEEDDKVSSFF